MCCRLNPHFTHLSYPWSQWSTGCWACCWTLKQVQRTTFPVNFGVVFMQSSPMITSAFPISVTIWTLETL